MPKPPVMALVRPTASSGAGRKPSCSRTRYPATEPVATTQRPVRVPDAGAALDADPDAVVPRVRRGLVSGVKNKM